MIREFRSLAPIDSMALLLDPSFASEAQGVVAGLGDVASETGVTIVPVPWSEPLRASADAIPDGIDGVLVAPLFHVDQAEVRALASALVDRGLPSLSIGGDREVELGLWRRSHSRAARVAWGAASRSRSRRPHSAEISDRCGSAARRDGSSS